MKIHENSMKMDDLRVALFQEAPHRSISNGCWIDIGKPVRCQRSGPQGPHLALLLGHYSRAQRRLGQVSSSLDF